jgi:hypothetical protein
MRHPHQCASQKALEFHLKQADHPVIAQGIRVVESTAAQGDRK